MGALGDNLSRAPGLEQRAGETNGTGVIIPRSALFAVVNWTAFGTPAWMTSATFQNQSILLYLACLSPQVRFSPLAGNAAPPHAVILEIRAMAPTAGAA